ncbi:transcriptional regulator TACO1-like protein [Halenospora varia]|nr:transcriptional regulator TACO1-like protein [Halenospora varia]
MAAFSRGLRFLAPRGEFLCSRCRQISTTPVIQSGHSRWSKIKHDKGAADNKKSKTYAALVHEIALVSKTDGPDPKFNFKLAAVLEKAKKAGLPKAHMESAIARGQGKTASGAILQYVALEAIVPQNVSVIIEAETDNAKRTLGELRVFVKVAKGSVGPTSFLFQKKGRVAFEKDERNLGVDDVLDEAIEAGAEDVETDEDGALVIWTEPTKTTAVAEAMKKSLNLKVEASEIIWDPNEDTKAPLNEAEPDSLTALNEFIDMVRDHNDVQAIYANATQGSLSDEAWEEFASKLD